MLAASNGKGVKNLSCNGARSRNRTGTPISQRGILSPLCLPIPPSGPWSFEKLEAGVGIEPAYTALQAAA